LELLQKIMRKIALINAGFGNIGSVINTLNRINLKSFSITNGEELYNFKPTHIIMPGVGAVNQAMTNLTKNNFLAPLDYFIKEKKILFCGICVGMQLLSEFSEEFGESKCLGWIPGKVKSLKSNKKSLPHMGWNTIINNTRESKLLKNIYGKDMYFCHSYALNCEEKYIIAETIYGNKFISAVNKENIYGIQCHPEKSLYLGDTFFKNFFSLGEDNF
tara:strand:- start:5213 stop:5863 length:651 start_codon:yes stop_codon:yes gene_type:complete